MDKKLEKLIENHVNLVELYAMQFCRQIKLREVEELKFPQPQVSYVHNLVAEQTKQISKYDLPQEQKDVLKLYIQENAVKNIEKSIINSEIGECMTCEHLNKPEEGKLLSYICKKFNRKEDEVQLPCFGYEPVDYSTLSKEEIDRIESTKKTRNKELEVARQILKETKEEMQRRYS